MLFPSKATTWLGLPKIAFNVVPLQDVLRLGTEARQNTPSQASGNWSWRFRAEALTPELAGGIRLLTTTYGRAPVSESPASLAKG